MYCRLEVGQVVNCITIQHCIVRQWDGKEAVSRYNYCIVTEAKMGRWLGEGWARRAFAEPAGGRAWARGRALQAAGRAGVGRSRRAGVRSGTVGRARRAGSWAAGARSRVWQARGKARQTRGLVARAGLRLCTRCTRPIFDPFRLGIVPESIFGRCL